MDAKCSRFQGDGGSLEGRDRLLDGDLEGLRHRFVDVFDQRPFFGARAEVAVLRVAAVDETFGTGGQLDSGSSLGECAVGRAVEDGIWLYFGDGGDEGFRHGVILVGLVVECSVWLEVMETWVDGEDALQLAMDQATDIIIGNLHWASPEMDRVFVAGMGADGDLRLNGESDRAPYAPLISCMSPAGDVDGAG